MAKPIPNNNRYLTSFIRTYLVKKADIKRLSIAFFYGLYFKDIDLSLLESGTLNAEYILFQLLAEQASTSSLRKYIQKLSFEIQVRLIGHSLQHYREGSYFILTECEQLFSKGAQRYHRLYEFLLHLKRHYYDIDYFQELLNQEKTINEKALENIQHQLEAKAEKQIQEISSLFKQLTVLFKSHDEHRFSLEDFRQFAKTFGLYGHYPYITLLGKEILTTSLLDKMRILQAIFRDPLRSVQIKPEEFQSVVSFLLMLRTHLASINGDPTKYAEGLKWLTIAIPTSGKRLDKQAGLHSLIDGVNFMQDFLNANLPSQKQLKSPPIFVFDQSDEPIFIKNKRYIHRINKIKHSNVVHVSRKEALAIANKIGIEPLLNTTKEGNFGFAGSRNCVFLLAPLLKHLYLKGKTTINSVLKLDRKTLLHLFKDVVLSANNRDSGNTILMIDDDMQIPEANLFCHALFSQDCANSYGFSHGFCYGRATKYLNRFRALQEILYHPEDTFDITQWVNIPFSITMAEYIGKPKICLNVPFGQEERHLDIGKVINPLLQLSYHLGGTRYPNQHIPSRHFIDLDKHLAKFIPYTMDINLSMDLIEPSNVNGRCIFPWNDIPFSTHFSCLNDVFNYISDKKTKKIIQQRFWRNVNEVFGSSDNDIPLRKCLHEIINMNVDAIFNGFKRQHPLNHAEKTALTKIGNLYKEFQQDATLLWSFATSLIKSDLGSHQIKDIINQTKSALEKQNAVSLSDYPFTQHFYLLCLSVGAGEFSDNIHSIIR